MEVAATEIRDKTDELLVVLYEDVRHIQRSLSHLDNLRTLIIKRDEAALRRLLDVIRSETDGYSLNESKRQLIRKELAAALDCSADQVTLSRLDAMLPPAKSRSLARIRAELRGLVDELRGQYLATAALLSDCARFNRNLLATVLELGKTDTVTYNCSGAATRQNGTAFVNFQF